jgi:hypothetical protein
MIGMGDNAAVASRPAPARTWARQLALACAVVTALAAPGCGIFTPATPDPPGGGATVTLPLLSSPDSALYSLQLGLTTKNSQYYEHAIAETTLITVADFHAVFDPQDTLDYAVSTGARPPQDWTSQNERTFFSYFVSRQPVNYTVYFLPDDQRQDLQSGSDEWIFYRHYRVYAATTPVAVGLVDLTIRRLGVNGEWKITFWVDRRDTSATALRTYGRQRLDSLTP